MGRLTHTVSGSIATVRSPAVAPIESLKVHFSPIQEGTGDPSPSNIRPITGWTGVTGYRSGKNLIKETEYAGQFFNVSDGTDLKGTSVRASFSKSNNVITITATVAWYGCIFATDMLKPGNYTIHTELSDSNVRRSAYITNENLVTKERFSLVNDDRTITLTETSRIVVTISLQEAGTGTVTNMQVEYGDAATSYTSYSEETVPVTFSNFSANLFDSTNETFSRITKLNGIYSNNDTDDRTNAQLQIQLYNDMTVLSTLEPHNFTETGIISFNFSNDNSLCNRICFKHNGITKDFRIYVPFIYGMGTYTISCNIISNDPTTVGGLQLSDISIKRGNENVIDYANNKVYGGYVDLATGEIYAEYGSYVLTGSASDGFVYRGTVTHGDNVHYQFGTKLFDRIVENTSSTKTYCNIAKATISQTGWALDFMFYAGTPQYQVNFFIKDSVCDSTEESFNAWLSEHNVHFVYKLATPQLIATLTPQELETFKGYSNFWSNAGDVDVTYQVVESSEMTKERQKIFAGNAPTIHTASGSVANFEMEPGLNRNLKSCKVGFLPVQEGSGDPFPPINQNGSIVGVDNLHNESELSSFKIHFSPIQAGSGDPSPTNIRPITGWTGVTGYKGGKNLYSAGDQSFERMKKVSLGRTFSPGTYTLSLEATSTDTDDSKCDVYLFYGETSSGKSKGFSRDTRDSWTFTVDRVFDSLWMYAAQTWLASEGDTVTFSNIQLEVGSTATSYEPYSSPTSYPVSWESNGTVYGGYVDVVTGDVYKTHEIVDLGTLNYVYDSTAEQFVCYSGITFGDRESFICSNYKTQSVVTYWTEMIDKTISGHSTDHSVFRIKDTDYTDATVFKTAMDGVKLAYELITPVKVGTISPTSISLTNSAIYSFWSNANAVTVETVGNVRPIKGWSKLNICSSKQNIFDPNELTTININGSDRNAVAYTSPGTYKLKAYGSSTEAYLSGIVKNYDGTWSSVYYVVGNTYAQNMSITIVNGQTLYVYDMQNSPKETSISRFVSWQFQVSLGNSFLDSYESYSGSKYFIEFPVQGKNLLDVSNMTHGAYNIGSIPNILEPNTTYTFSVNGDTNKTYRLFAVMEDYNTGVGSGISLNASYINKTSNLSFRTFTTPANIKDYPYLALAGNDSSAGNVPINDIKPQVELGSTATSYEPYDNSIYGGYVNLVTGEVWSNYMVLDLGSTNWAYYKYGSYNGGYNSLFQKNLKKYKATEIPNAYCTHLFMTYDNAFDLYLLNHNITINVFGMIKVTYDEATSAEHLKSLLSGVLLVAELETPQLVTTLTPTQIQALKGTNNILSDANGIIEVKYWSH